MSKKRNLAVLMAAATVATSVAPVFADTTASLDGQDVSAKDSAKLDQLKSEIEGLLNTKYTTDEDLLLDKTKAGKSVYDIKANTTVSINSMRDLDKLIADLKGENAKITINATDLGFKEVDGKIVDNEVKKYKSDDLKAMRGDVLAGDYTVIEDPDEDNNQTAPVAKVVDYSDNSIVLELLNNDDKMTIKVGDLKTIYETQTAGEFSVLGVKYKEDSVGNKLDKDGEKTIISANYVVEGFDTYKTTIEDKENKSYTIVNKDIVESINASELYNLNLKKLTQEGNSIANFIYDYTAAEDKADTVTGTYKDGVLKLTVKTNKDGIENKFTNLSIKGTAKELKDLSEIFTISGAEIKDGSDNLITASQSPVDIATLAGANREETAIRVSQEAYSGTDKADSVVLVAGNKIADGLTATPFAAAKDAPVLLTGSDKISDSVMDEIERVMVSTGTVYLVGGESSLSKNIEDQLDKKFIKVERIAGTNRMDTSLKIAQTLVKEEESTLNNGLLVAGGYAEADAMSIAAVAADGTKLGGITPILLTDNNGLTQGQLTWLNREDAKVTKAFVAGGVNSVPTTVNSQLNPFVSGTTTRLAGENRQETNAKVIAEFYTTATNVYVAKSDNNGLVDALPSGVLAAKAGKVGPIVLATDELNSVQKSALEKAGFDADSANKTQIGNGIADKVWEAINKIK